VPSTSSSARAPHGFPRISTYSPACRLEIEPWKTIVRTRLALTYWLTCMLTVSAARPSTEAISTP
jgi:hypothetical protein